MSAVKKARFAWKYRRQLWKYRDLIRHRKEAAGVLLTAAVLVAAVARENRE